MLGRQGRQHPCTPVRLARLVPDPTAQSQCRGMRWRRVLPDCIREAGAEVRPIGLSELGSTARVHGQQRARTLPGDP